MILLEYIPMNWITRLTKKSFVNFQSFKKSWFEGWNRSPAQVGCMRQALGPGALGGPGGSGWRGRWEGGSGWGRHVNPRTFHFNVWQNSLQIKKKNSKKKIKKIKKVDLDHLGKFSHCSYGGKNFWRSFFIHVPW